MAGAVDHGASPQGAVAASEPIHGVLRGHLTRAQLESVLTEIAEVLAKRPATSPVLLDCSAMTSYDLDARHAFVDWNKSWRSRVSQVAIVTSNRLYHVVIATMSLASGQNMRGFAELDAALAWLQGRA
ncbi:MAG: STAS/SEC14 domain-containing protein [Myxococcales bacterium]|nr:STAS/SEC14 domain-containing protein [Myxococcales bacterium]